MYFNKIIQMIRHEKNEKPAPKVPAHKQVYDQNLLCMLKNLDVFRVNKYDIIYGIRSNFENLTR